VPRLERHGKAKVACQRPCLIQGTTSNDTLTQIEKKRSGSGRASGGKPTGAVWTTINLEGQPLRGTGDPFELLDRQYGQGDGRTYQVQVVVLWMGSSRTTIRETLRYRRGLS